MELIKRQRVGTWITLGVAVLAIVSLILYAVNGASVGYFQYATETKVIVMSVFAIIFALGAIVLAQFEFDGMVGKVAKIAVDVLRVGAAILLIASLFAFIGSRLQGLSYIFFSNEDVILEVQTPENMASAYMAITGFVFYGIAWLAAVVGVFFPTEKKQVA